jgi:hypothetical protein
MDKATAAIAAGADCQSRAAKSSAAECENFFMASGGGMLQNQTRQSVEMLKRQTRSASTLQH